MGEPVEGYLDQAVIQDGFLSLSGWIEKSSANCWNQRAYLRIQDDQSDKNYLMPQMARPDVAEILGDERYTMCGFSGIMPANALPQGEYMVSLLVEIDGQVYRGESCQLQISSDAVTLQ